LPNLCENFGKSPPCQPMPLYYRPKPQEWRSPPPLSAPISRQTRPMPPLRTSPRTPKVAKSPRKILVLALGNQDLVPAQWNSPFQPSKHAASERLISPTWLKSHLVLRNVTRDPRTLLEDEVPEIDITPPG